MSDDPDCVCAGQEDLTALVDVEHIRGSMPAGAREREQARHAWYEHLLEKPCPSVN